MKSFRSIVITGASNGIGKALAHGYAAPGVALALTGRNRERLAAVAEECRARGAEVVASAIDVTDRESLAAWFQTFDDTHPVDLVVANAGVSIDQTRSSLDDFSVIRKTMEINFGGVLNTVEPLAGRMAARRQGQIGLVSSLASYIGLPYSASYNASKAAVRVWGESIRFALKPDNVGVSVVLPGFVVSALAGDDAPFPRPFLMSAERASAIIRGGLARNKARIAFPFPTTAMMWFGNTIPASWAQRLLGG